MNVNENAPTDTDKRAIRLAIATHLTHALVNQRAWEMTPATETTLVDKAYSLADLLLAKSGL